MILCSHEEDQAVAHLCALYRTMKATHRFLTSDEDFPYAALLACTEADERALAAGNAGRLCQEIPFGRVYFPRRISPPLAVIVAFGRRFVRLSEQTVKYTRTSVFSRFCGLFLFCFSTIFSKEKAFLPIIEERLFEHHPPTREASNARM